jgi:hypothetical protein
MSYASSVVDNSVNRQPPSWRYLSFFFLYTKIFVHGWITMCLKLSPGCYNKLDAIICCIILLDAIEKASSNLSK